jgi:hypothetical protein
VVLAVLSNRGSSFTQGGHHVDQKFTTTPLPLRSSSLMVSPLVIGASNTGA